MYGYILKKINLIIPLLVICFLITAECSIAAPPPAKKAPVQQKTTGTKQVPKKVVPTKTTQKEVPVKQDSQTTNTTDEKTVKEEPQANTETKNETTPAEGSKQPVQPVEETPSNPIEAMLKPYGLGIMHVAIGGGVLILIIIIAVVLAGKGKSKSVCQKCGGKVLPGNTICESCKNQEMMLQMENNAGEIQQNQQNAGFGTPTNSFDTPVTNTGMGTMQTPTSSFMQPTVTTPPPSAQPQPAPAKKATPTGRVVAQINIRKGANNGYRFKYYESQNQVSIGTDKECDFVLEDEAAEDDKLPKIASRHAVITLENGSTFTIHDISTSGMLINNNPDKQHQLKTGDVIKIGTTELAFARL